ncbi:hypothetical protein LXL04_015298 [Taraxacum kok-saghyz]
MNLKRKKLYMSCLQMYSLTQVVKGLGEGIMSMKVGSKRRLYVPGTIGIRSPDPSQDLSLPAALYSPSPSSPTLRGCLIARRTTDSVRTDHGLGPRTRSDILPQTRSGDKNRRLIFLPLMSDSVRSPRCLVGAFDVGLGPDSLRLDPSELTQSTTIKLPLTSLPVNDDR